jgi:hypothetical protein
MRHRSRSPSTRSSARPSTPGRPSAPTSPRPSTGAPAHRRTGERVDALFSFGARRIATVYINNTVIPVLCRKAGVPDTDVRGRITSHRARSTIASQLYNAKEPMTLFELQAWLGHRSPTSTQFYAKITPNTLTRAYTDAGYFARNVRTIEVLIDRDAVASGAAVADQPWQHYDLGHGYCGYSFFEQCPHRMACARCDFYTPKASGKAQRRKTTCSACWPRFHSPTTSGRLSTTAATRSTLSSVASPTFPRHPERHRGRSGCRRRRRCFQSSISTPAPDDASLIGHADAGLQPDTRPGDPDSTEASK